jgi:hypothetical protein
MSVRAGCLRRPGKVCTHTGYVPTVVILSYLGSRGNRAKWIGGGCLLVSVANIIISSPHFVFPDTPQLANDTAVEAIFGESLSRGV